MQEMTFRDWLLIELKKRDWTQSDLAKQAGVSEAAISGVLSGRRNVGTDLATAIAKALKLPPEEVFRAAGLLPPKKNGNDLIDAIIHRAKELSKDDLDAVLEFIGMLERLRNRKSRK